MITIKRFEYTKPASKKKLAELLKKYPLFAQFVQDIKGCKVTGPIKEIVYRKLKKRLKVVVDSVADITIMAEYLWKNLQEINGPVYADEGSSKPTIMTRKAKEI